MNESKGLVEFLRERLDAAERDERDRLATDRFPDARSFTLADIAAKRRIIEWCSERDQIYVGAWHSDPDAPGPNDFVPGHLKRPADAVVLRFLAEPYAGHPDYRPEWSTQPRPLNTRPYDGNTI